MAATLTAIRDQELELHETESRLSFVACALMGAREVAIEIDRKLGRAIDPAILRVLAERSNVRDQLRAIKGKV